MIANGELENILLFPEPVIQGQVQPSNLRTMEPIVYMERR